jgi:hypothetical protein
VALLIEYNRLFKRRDHVSLTHKWSSEDDDDYADIESEPEQLDDDNTNFARINGQMQDSD